MGSVLPEPPYAPRFARKGANPSLRTIEYIDMVLKEADGPMSKADILRQLKAWEHGTTRQSLNAALAYQAQRGLVLEGSKGVQRVPQAKASVLETIRRKRTQ